MNHHHPARFYSNRVGRAGQTLVEVVFALAVVSFCILPLLALLSVGCVGYNSAIKQSVQADIIQQVRVLAANLNPNPNINVMQIPITYYREDGTATTQTDTTAVYKAVVTVVPQPAASTTSPSPTPSVLLVNKVQISFIPSGQVLANEVIHVTPRVDAVDDTSVTAQP